MSAQLKNLQETFHRRGKAMLCAVIRTVNEGMSFGIMLFSLIQTKIAGEKLSPRPHYEANGQSVVQHKEVVLVQIKLNHGSVRLEHKNIKLFWIVCTFGTVTGSY